MSLAQRAIVGVLWSGVSSYLSFAIGFSGQLILVRILSPEDFGVIALAISIFEVMAILMAWCFSIAIIQMPEHDTLNDTAFWFCLGQGAILLIVAGIIAIALNWIYPGALSLPWVFGALGLSRAIAPVTAIYSAQMEKRLNFKRFSIIGCISSGVATSGAIFLALSGAGVWSLVAKELVTSIVNLFGYRLASGWRFKGRYDPAIGRRLLKFGSKMVVSRGLEAAFYRLDTLLVGILGGVGSAGYYSQARYLVDLAHAGVAPVTNCVALPVYAMVQNDAQRLGEVYRMGRYFLVRVMTPVSLFLALFPSEIVTTLYGQRWAPTGDVLQWLAFFPLLASVFENGKVLLYGIGAQGTAAWIRLLQITTACPLMWFGFQNFGLAGVALGVMVSILAGNLAIHLFIRRYMLTGFLENIARPFFSGLVAVLCVLWLRAFVFATPSQLETIVLLIITLLVYVAVLVLSEYRILLRHIAIIAKAVRSRPTPASLADG